MTKEEIRTALLLNILDGLRDLLKRDPEMQMALITVNFRENPDVSKCGNVVINYYYQNQ